jgi:DNA-directed RNA polymerase specialized sigma24 family protein
MEDQSPNFKDLSQRKKEWSEVEDLVMEYQKQFQDVSSTQKYSSQDAAQELLRRFSPLFKKYITLLKNGQIDFNDKEMKSFVCSFIEDPSLQRALRRHKQKAEYRSEIYAKFNFVKETYGSLQDDEILVDLQQVFLIIAKRYKQMGKNFCAYLYNSYKHEISRHIKKFIRNPLNISYKHVEYEDCANGHEEELITENRYEDTMYEDAMGMPDLTWISGKNCSDLFMGLTPLDRKILIKYYMESWNDRQIASEFGIHINTVNQKRRYAVATIAKSLKIDPEDIKRNRRSGKKAIMPLQ